MFCPSEVVWGNAAEWGAVAVGALAAIATVWAVLVALKSSAQADRHLAASLARDERERAAKAARLAIAFENELFLLAGDAYRTAEGLDDALSDGDLQLAHTFAMDVPQMEHIVLLTRLVEHLDAFDPATAGTLLNVVSRWQAVKLGPVIPPKIEHPLFSLAMERVSFTMHAICGIAIEARKAIRPLLDQPADELAPLDIKQLAAEIRGEELAEIRRRKQ